MSNLVKKTFYQSMEFEGVVKLFPNVASRGRVKDKRLVTSDYSDMLNSWLASNSVPYFIEGDNDDARMTVCADSVHNIQGIVIVQRRLVLPTEGEVKAAKVDDVMPYRRLVMASTLPGSALSAQLERGLLENHYKQVESSADVRRRFLLHYQAVEEGLRGK